MGDSASLTIEFLRARLHFERSLTRMARQRSAILAKRVIELEEQHETMIFQRNEAVQAAAKVLTILRTEAIDESSGLFNLNPYYDDVPFGVQRNDETSKEENTSTSSRICRSEVDEAFLESELEVCSIQGKSLSCKGCSDGPDPHQGQKITEIKETQSWSSLVPTVDSLQKHCVSMSCQKMKQKKHRSAVETKVDKSRLLDAHDKREDTRFWEEQNEELQRVLEQQAEFIHRFQEEENAQIEWEKYNANERSTLAFCESGSHPLLKDNICEPKEETTAVADRNQHHDKEATLSAEKICSTKETTKPNLSVPTSQNFHGTSLVESKATTAAFPNGVVPNNPITTSGNSSHACTGGLLALQYNHLDVDETESSSQDFTFPVQEIFDRRAMGKQIQGLPYDNSKTSHDSNSTLHQASLSSVYPISKLPIWGSQRKPTQAPNSSLGGVLEVLQQAKVSLRHKLNDLPLPSQGTLKVAPSTYYRGGAIKTCDALDIPTLPAGFFGLQTGSYLQANFSGPKFYGSGLSSTASHRDRGYVISVSNDRPSKTSHMEAGFKAPVSKQDIDSYNPLGTGMPASTASLFHAQTWLSREPFHDASPKPYIPAGFPHSFDRKGSNSNMRKL